VYYNTSNQTTSRLITYDAAGDVTVDMNTGNSYLYDGEGRICAVASTPMPSMTTMTGYLYDAEGRRVAKGTIRAWSCDPSSNGFTTTADYVLGPNGEQASEMSVSGGASTWSHTNVWAGGKLLATYDMTGKGLHFYLDDPLGTRRVQTDELGVVEQTCSSLPFGDGLTCTGSATTPTEHHFTGKERDTESGNDYFGARYYSSSMGRFMTPDPSGLTYAIAANPQSLNLYSYALNNPLKFIDPTGMYCFYGGKGDTPANDSDPTDYDFTDEPGDCGGQWIDNPSSTVTVSAGGDNGNTLSTFPSDVSQNFQFIPGKGCAAALKTAGANGSAINNYYNNYQAPINSAANANGVDPNLLAAVGVRESGLPANPDVVQANGNGRGLFQIDLGGNPNVSTAQAFDPTSSANFAAGMLSSNMSFLANAHPNFNGVQLAQATAATYNMGLGNHPVGKNISGNPNTIDAGTTGGNYGSNVVAISVDCF
jgi:RHS repeat-associated protein